MPRNSEAEGSPHVMPLAYRSLTISRISLRLQPTRSNWTATSSSCSRMHWLGSDLGNFLYWFGEQLLDLWIGLIIRIRLLSIHSSLVRKGLVERVDPPQARHVRRICEDLLELCRYVSLCMPNVASLTHNFRNSGTIIR